MNTTELNFLLWMSAYGTEENRSLSRVYLKLGDIATFADEQGLETGPVERILIYITDDYFVEQESGATHNLCCTFWVNGREFAAWSYVRE